MEVSCHKQHLLYFIDWWWDSDDCFFYFYFYYRLWKHSPHTLPSSYKTPCPLCQSKSRGQWMRWISPTAPAGSVANGNDIKKNILLNFGPKTAVFLMQSCVILFSPVIYPQRKTKNRSRNAKGLKVFFRYVFFYYDKILFIISQKWRAVGQTLGLSCANREAQACSDQNDTDMVKWQKTPGWEHLKHCSGRNIHL